MRNVIATLSIIAGAVLLSTSLHANFTLFDMAKDSMFITRGEFTSLERTPTGDRLTLQCDEMIKGELEPGTQVVLEAFQPQAADDALGRVAIVCFNLIDGKHYFVNHPYSWRSFIFEESDVHPSGLDQNETALRNFVAINRPHEEQILTQLQKRSEYSDLSYMGEFDSALIQAWKDELLNQAAWAGTVAARDAAKALVEHELFKGVVTVSDLEALGEIVPQSATGTIERAYLLEAIRNQNSAHPGFETLVGMVREETSEACVGKLANLFVPVDREMVLGAMGEMATNRNHGEQSRVNALQVLEAFKDTDGLPYVHKAIEGELEAGDTSKKVVRQAMMALRQTPDSSNVEFLAGCLEHEYISESWELTQRAWVAYAVVDSNETNNVIRNQFVSADNAAKKRFFQKLLPSNKIIRKLMIIHPED